MRAKETCNVFEQYNSGACFSNEASKVIKESRALPSKPRSRAHARQRDVLAGESSGPNIGLRNVSCVEFLDVFMVRDFRPVPFEDAPAEFVDFTLKGDFESGAFKANVKPANPGEQGGGFETQCSVGAVVSAALRTAGNVLSIYLGRHRGGKA